MLALTRGSPPVGYRPGSVASAGPTVKHWIHVRPRNGIDRAFSGGKVQVQGTRRGDDTITLWPRRPGRSRSARTRGRPDAPRLVTAGIVHQTQRPTSPVPLVDRR